MQPRLKKNLPLLILAAALSAAVFIQFTRSHSEAERRERVSWTELDMMLSDGNSAGALALLDGRIAAHPNNGLLHYFKARVLFEEGENYKALAETERALKLGYPQTAAWQLKGVLLGRRLGDHKKQAEFSSKALSLDPSDDSSYLLRAEARAALKDYAGAARDLTSYLAFYPKDVTALIDRAAANYELKDYAAALSDAGKALALDRKKDYAHYVAGRSQAALGDLKGAAVSFASAIELNPERYEYYLARAEAYEKLNDFYDAAWDYSTAMAAPEVNCCASYYYLLGSNMYRVAERDSALKAAGEAVRLGGEVPDYLELRGRILAEAGRFREAARDFRRLAVLDPARARDAETFLDRLEGKKKPE